MNISELIVQHPQYEIFKEFSSLVQTQILELYQKLPSIDTLNLVVKLKEQNTLMLLEKLNRMSELQLTQVIHCLNNQIITNLSLLCFFILDYNWNEKMLISLHVKDEDKREKIESFCVLLLNMKILFPQMAKSLYLEKVDYEKLYQLFQLSESLSLAQKKQILFKWAKLNVQKLDQMASYIAIIQSRGINPIPHLVCIKAVPENQHHSLSNILQTWPVKVLEHNHFLKHLFSCEYFNFLENHFVLFNELLPYTGYTKSLKIVDNYIHNYQEFTITCIYLHLMRPFNSDQLAKIILSQAPDLCLRLCYLADKIGMDDVIEEIYDLNSLSLRLYLDIIDELYRLYDVQPKRIFFTQINLASLLQLKQQGLLNIECIHTINSIGSCDIRILINYLYQNQALNIDTLKFCSESANPIASAELLIAKPHLDKTINHLCCLDQHPVAIADFALACIYREHISEESFANFMGIEHIKLKVSLLLMFGDYLLTQESHAQILLSHSLIKATLKCFEYLRPNMTTEIFANILNWFEHNELDTIIYRTENSQLDQTGLIKLLAYSAAPNLVSLLNQFGQNDFLASHLVLLLENIHPHIINDETMHHFNHIFEANSLDFDHFYLNLYIYQLVKDSEGCPFLNQSTYEFVLKSMEMNDESLMMLPFFIESMYKEMLNHNEWSMLIEQDLLDFLLCQNTVIDLNSHLSTWKLFYFIYQEMNEQYPNIPHSAHLATLCDSLSLCLLNAQILDFDLETKLKFLNILTRKDLDFLITDLGFALNTQASNLRYVAPS